MSKSLGKGFKRCCYFILSLKLLFIDRIFLFAFCWDCASICGKLSWVIFAVIYGKLCFTTITDIWWLIKNWPVDCFGYNLKDFFWKLMGFLSRAFALFPTTLAFWYLHYCVISCLLFYIFICQQIVLLNNLLLFGLGSKTSLFKKLVSWNLTFTSKRKKGKLRQNLCSLVFYMLCIQCCRKPFDIWGNKPQENKFKKLFRQQI